LTDAASAPQLLAALADPSLPVAVLTVAAPPAGAGVPWLYVPSDPQAAAAIVAAAAELARARAASRLVETESQSLATRLAESEERISALNRIGISLSAERDVEKLLDTILTESRRFSRSEAGSLYLVEQGPEGKRLRFKLAQNDAVAF